MSGINCLLIVGILAVLMWYFCTIAPRLDISLNKNRMTFFFFFEPEVFLFEFKKPKIHPHPPSVRPGC